MTRPVSSDLALLAAIAATLDDLAREAEDFGLTLCGDAAVATRYLVQLQQVDRIAQSLRELARVLPSPEPRAALENMCLGDLRNRLEQAIAD